jgi:hypothetical protein
VKTNAPTTVYASPGNTTIVVKDRKGNIRDVDEYNRRYDSKDYDFSQENDTLYIDEKEDDGLVWTMAISTSIRQRRRAEVTAATAVTTKTR